MRNYDAIIVITVSIAVLFTWLSTWIYMQRKLVRALSDLRREQHNRDAKQFELGVIAGRDEQRREMMRSRLAKRREQFPNI